ncbi:MAG: acyl carrier protein [Lachnospiraceae bacterium]|nr:acyl carrier protein [Lachnospiraceae bacterium]
MTKEKIRIIILESLEELGIYVEELCISECFEILNRDMDLRDYIVDSLTFVSFVMILEEKLGIEFPDELLLIDNLASINGFSYLLAELINYREEENESAIEKNFEEAH